MDVLLMTKEAKMFRFFDDRYTHMPYAAHGSGTGCRLFCCIRDDNGKWKIHTFDGDWRRVKTGMPEDATECSPFGEYDPNTRKWSVTFIAGGSETQGFMRFALYRIPDLAHPKTERIVNADAGYYWKDILFHAGRISGIDIEYGARRRHIDIPEAEYIYRLTNNADDPAELLVTGKRKDDSLFTLAINLRNQALDELEDGDSGEPLYKPCIIADEWFTAQRNGEFEERHIVRVRARRIPRRWEDIVITDERTEEED